MKEENTLPTRVDEYAELVGIMGISVSKHLFDEHFTLLWANDNYFNIIGYTKEEYETLFHNCADYYLADNKDIWDKIYNNIIEAINNSKKGCEVTIKMPLKNGYKWVRLTSMLTEEKQNGIPVAYTIMNPINNLMQQQLEQEITYENIPGFVAKYKITRDGEFILIDANRKFIDFTGTDPNDFLSHASFETIMECSRDELHKNMLIMRSGSPVHFTVRAESRNGKHTWLQLNGECVFRGDGFLYYQIVYIDVTDITEQRAMQKKLEIQSVKLREALEEAKKANATKSDFLNRMSYNIRTPLHAIIGMTNIARANKDNYDKVISCMEKIDGASRLLLSVINEILDMSKIVGGKLVLAKESFNLGKLLQELIIMHQVDIYAKQIELDICITSLEHEVVKGDMPHIKQILMNILSNAIKFTSVKGRIKIEVIEKELGNRTSNYIFVFDDNGCGMKPEFLDKVFLPFECAKDEQITHLQGSGLGMAISGKIANIMNGDIKVESEYGKGSRFTVNIPLKYSEQDEQESLDVCGLQALIVDDDKGSCLTTSYFLHDIGIMGDFVCSGRDAVNKVRLRHKMGNDYFAILIESKLHDTDSLEIIRQMREIVGNDVPIIVLSLFESDVYEKMARDMNVSDFIIKPVYRSCLLEVMKKYSCKEEKATEQNALSKLSGVNYSGKRILLCRDNQRNREGAGEIIGTTGVSIETAANGKEAVEMIFKSKNRYYDLVLMDVQMPVMDGYEAARQIRSLHRMDTRTMPIVAMTANTFAEDIMDAVKAGMNYHLSKPLDIEALFKMLDKYLK